MSKWGELIKYLNSVDLGSKELWEYNKREIRKRQIDKGMDSNY